MNMNRMKALATKSKMEHEAMYNNQPAHARHVKDYCEYADATAKAAADEALDSLKPQIEKEIARQMQQGKVSVEVDKASVKAAKKTIDDLYAYIRKAFR